MDDPSCLELDVDLDEEGLAPLDVQQDDVQQDGSLCRVNVLPSPRERAKRHAASSGGAQHSQSKRSAALTAYTVAAPARIPGPAGFLTGLHQAEPGLPVGGTQTAAAMTAHQALLHPDFHSRQWAAGLARAGAGSFEDLRQKGAPTVASVSRTKAAVKVPSLLVVVSSLQPSASPGDTYAVLKDPTGHIGAGIHSAVLSRHGAIDSGSVLLLRLVTALWTPAQVCLCITAANIQEAFHAHSECRGLDPAPTPSRRPEQLLFLPAREATVSQRDSRGAAQPAAAADIDDEPAFGSLPVSQSAELAEPGGQVPAEPVPPMRPSSRTAAPCQQAAKQEAGQSLSGLEIAELMEGCEEEDEMARIGLWTPPE